MSTPSIAKQFSYLQKSDAYGEMGIEISGSAIVDTRAKMFAIIDDFFNHKAEYYFMPLLADLLVSTVRGYRTTFTPIETMKTAVLADTNEEDAERHLIAFLHEVQEGLPTAIETYKETYPRYLLPDAVQTYTNGHPLLSEVEETALVTALNALPGGGGKKLTYATGPIGEFYRDFMQKAYDRATTILALSKRFDGETYENLSVAQLSRMAKVTNGEIEGFKIEVIDDTEYYYVTLHNRRMSLRKSDAPIFVAYEDLENVTLSSPYNSTDTKNVVKLTNMGDTALVAKVGRTSPAESAVNRADYSTRTRITTPSEHTYTKDEVGKYITFEKMEKPMANSLPEIDLVVGDEHVLSLVNRFSGKFIEEGYTLNSVEPDKISVVSNENNDAYTITALAPGFTTFRIGATNPAGRTNLVVDISIT